ncbi:MAG: type I 3-dehydroquinate dehydratase [Planctomycetes bacterium]|nr:type I 3-dehydroquinate dehydratase [Planctomycetota bacterium]
MARIIASVFAESREQVVQKAAAAAMAGADWLELRLDRWPHGQDLAATIAAVRLPVLVACRTPEDGGQFRGTLGERRELLSAALDGGASGIDLEGTETWNPPVGRTRLKLRIRSFHSFTGVPKELAAIRDRLHQTAGTVAKIVVTAHDLADAAPVLELLQATDQDEQPTVAFAMGRTAWPTRVLAAALDAPFVYGRVDDDTEPTAPGQPPIGLLAGLYRVRELSRQSAVFGLLGNPALHSAGPWLHNRALRRLGVDGVYLPFETSRPDAVLAMLPRRQLRGLSVTAPHKGALVAACARLSDEAESAEAVNTLVADGSGGFVGHLTDVVGVSGALAEAGVARGDGKVGVVFGSGGAARAAALALRQLGFATTVLGRSVEAMRPFAQRLGVTLGSLSERVLGELRPAVVVNATPVGSDGRDGPARLVPGWRPAAGTTVLDMVYRPAVTTLLADAAAAGAVVVPGLSMFLHQAAAQVRWFTGKELPVATLRSFLAGLGTGGV